MLEFDHPLALALIPAVWAVLLMIVAGGRRRDGSRTRTVLSLATRATILTLLAVALAGPHHSFTVSVPLGTAFLPDRSRSVSPAGIEEHESIRSRLGDPDVVPFGDRSSSDVRPALLEVAATDAHRILLATDGHLSGDAGPLLADLESAGRRTGVAALSAEREEVEDPPPRGVEIVIPPGLREDRPADLEVRAERAESVRLLVDGREIGRATVVAGEAFFPRIPLPAGRHLLVAVAEGPGGRAAAARECDVEGPLRVLLLGGGPASAFGAALASQGISVRRPAGEGMTAGDLDGVRAVVALPAFRLPADGGPLLPYVRRGGGLLVATGPAPGLGRYRDEPVADLLPATPLPPEAEPAPPPPEPPAAPREEDPPEGARPAEVEKTAATVTVVLVMDRSGSMRGEKIGLARAACFLAARALPATDRIGILAFNQDAEWLRPIGPAGELAEIRAALGRMTASGGTEIFTALEEASRAIREEETAVRHIILVSDGQDHLEGFRKLLDETRREAITVTTVGIGPDYEPRLLGTIARWGAGRFYPLIDPRELLQVVTLDTRRIVEAAHPPPGEPSPDVTAGAREPEEPPAPEKPERPPEPPATPPVPVRPASPLPFLAGLDFPDLDEVERTVRRFPAQVALTTPDDRPVLLFWRYGGGRVALLAADPGAWRDWPDLPRFAAQTVRMLAAVPIDAGRTGPEISVRDGTVRILARGGAPRAWCSVGEAEQTVPLRAIGPDRYEGRLPEATAGALLTIRVEGAEGDRTRTAVVVPPPAESSVRGVDEERIHGLARAAGRSPGDIPPEPEPERRPDRDPRHLPLLIVALALVPVDVAVRRVGR